MSQKAIIVHSADTRSPIAIGADRFVQAYVNDMGMNCIVFEDSSLSTENEEISIVIEDLTIEIMESPETVASYLNALS